MSLFDDAVTELFRTRFDALFRYLDRLSGDADLAKDLAQEAFVRLYQRRSMPDDASAWLVRVATNLYRDSRRNSQRRETIAERDPMGMAPSEQPAVDETVIEAETRSRVRAILDALPLRDRQILLLRHEGYSYRDIAQITGVAPGSVGTLLIRATHAFRQAFAERAKETDAALG